MMKMMTAMIAARADEEDEEDYGGKEGGECGEMSNCHHVCIGRMVLYVRNGGVWAVIIAQDQHGQSYFGYS